MSLRLHRTFSEHKPQGLKTDRGTGSLSISVKLNLTSCIIEPNVFYDCDCINHLSIQSNILLNVWNLRKFKMSKTRAPFTSPINGKNKSYGQYSSSSDKTFDPNSSLKNEQMTQILKAVPQFEILRKPEFISQPGFYLISVYFLHRE